MTIKKPTTWQSWEFENGRLRKSLPKDLVTENSGSSEEEGNREFLLTLALAFNDLKGLLQIHDSMMSVYGTASSLSPISAHLGEQQGIRMQIFKLLLATLHEVLVFIRESKDTYESGYIQRLLQETSKKTQLVWEIINKVAHEEPIDDERFVELEELPNFLVNARNNVGFHYQTRRRFLEGYRRFFFKGISGTNPEGRKWAYRSAEKGSFDASRYYYADAALQGYYIDLFGGEELEKKYVDKTLTLISLVVNAINDLLIEYHEALPQR